MLLRDPQAGIKAVCARAYAEPIHIKSAPPMSATMVGSAVPTLVSSRALRKRDIVVPTKKHSDVNDE